MTRSVALLFFFFLPSLLSAEPLPLEHFLKDGDYLDVSLSPGGKRFAARARVDGRIVLAVIDRETGQIVGGARPPQGNVIHSVDWINDERLLFSYAEERLDLDAPVPTGELFGMNYDGKRQEMLAGFRASDERTDSRLSNKTNDPASFYLVDTLEGDDRHVLIIEYPWSTEGNVWYDNRIKLPIVSRMNVYSGGKRKLETLPFFNARPYSTSDGRILLVTYEDEEGYFTAAYRESEDAEWQAITDAFDLSGDVTVVGVNDAGDAVFLRGHYGEEGFYTIFRLDLPTRAFEPLFTDLDADIIDVLFDPETGEVVAGKSMRGKPRYHYPDSAGDLANLHRMLAQAFGGQNMDIVSTTDDGSELLVHVRSDTNPGEYYVFNTQSKRAGLFWANRSWVDPRLMRPTIVDEVVTEDGFRLPVLLTLPETTKPAPLVVHPHGGPHGIADQWGFDPAVQMLANQGYAVLQVNFRGSGSLGARFERAGYREWGGKMIDDIAAATHWAMEKPGIDGERVCAYGASYGAYAAYMLAAREPDLLKCTAGYVGVYDLSMMFTKGDVPRSWGGTGYLERVIGTDPAELEDYSPVNHAGNIKAAALLVHGEADRRAPIAHGRAMRDALRDAGNEPEWIRIDQSGHGAGSLETRLELYEGLLAFLDEHLR